MKHEESNLVCCVGALRPNTVVSTDDIWAISEEARPGLHDCGGGNGSVDELVRRVDKVEFALNGRSMGEDSKSERKVGNCFGSC